MATDNSEGVMPFALVRWYDYALDILRLLIYFTSARLMYQVPSISAISLILQNDDYPGKQNSIPWPQSAQPYNIIHRFWKVEIWQTPKSAFPPPVDKHKQLPDFRIRGQAVAYESWAVAFPQSWDLVSLIFTNWALFLFCQPPFFISSPAASNQTPDPI